MLLSSSCQAHFRRSKVRGHPRDKHKRVSVSSGRLRPRVCLLSSLSSTVCRIRSFAAANPPKYTQIPRYPLDPQGPLPCRLIGAATASNKRRHHPSAPPPIPARHSLSHLQTALQRRWLPRPKTHFISLDSGLDSRTSPCAYDEPASPPVLVHEISLRPLKFTLTVLVSPPWSTARSAPMP